MGEFGHGTEDIEHNEVALSLSWRWPGEAVVLQCHFGNKVVFDYEHMQLCTVFQLCSLAGLP